MHSKLHSTKTKMKPHFTNLIKYNRTVKEQNGVKPQIDPKSTKNFKRSTGFQ